MVVVVVVVVGFLAKSGFTAKIFFPVAITQLNAFARAYFLCHSEQNLFPNVYHFCIVHSNLLNYFLLFILPISASLLYFFFSSLTITIIPYYFPFPSSFAILLLSVFLLPLPIQLYSNLSYCISVDTLHFWFCFVSNLLLGSVLIVERFDLWTISNRIP